MVTRSGHPPATHFFIEISTVFPKKTLFVINQSFCGNIRYTLNKAAISFVLTEYTVADHGSMFLKGLFK
jgi:hypothetical protein